jgi:transposase
MSRPVAQPLRLFTERERQELQRVSRAPSQTVIRHQRAIALLAVADGRSLSEAARAAGWRVHDTVTRLIRRFNERGLAALDDLPRSGHPRRYGPTERARIEQELRRSPFLKEDGTATWSLTTLQRSLREAPDGLPEISTFTILYAIHARRLHLAEKPNLV